MHNCNKLPKRITHILSSSAASGRQTSKEDPQRDIIQLNWKYYPIKLENIVRVTFLVREEEGVKKIGKKVWPFGKPVEGGEGGC